MAEVFCPSPEEVKDKQKPIDSKETIDALKAEILKESQRERKILILEMYLTKLVCSGKDATPIIKNIINSQNNDIFMGVIKYHEGKKDFNSLRLLFTKTGENGGFKINFYSDKDIYQALSATDLFGDFKNIQKNGQIYKNDGKSFGSLLLKDGDNVEVFDEPRYIVKPGDNLYRIVLNGTKNPELATICNKAVIQPGDIVIFGENQVSLKSKKDGEIKVFSINKPAPTIKPEAKPSQGPAIPTILPTSKPDFPNNSQDNSGKGQNTEIPFPGTKPPQKGETPIEAKKETQSNSSSDKLSDTKSEKQLDSWGDIKDPKKKEKAFNTALNTLISEIGDESIKKAIKEASPLLFNSKNETPESLKDHISSLSNDLQKVPSDIKELFLKNVSGVIIYMKSFKLSFQETLNDFKKTKEFVDKNLSGSNFDSLKDNISQSMGPLMYVLHEIPRQKFKTISLPDVISLIYFESEFKNSTESKTGSVGLLQTTSSVANDMKSHPEKYNADIIKELIERNGVASVDKLNKNHRRQYENSIDLGLMYLKMLEGNGRSYPGEASKISKDPNHFYAQVSNSLGNKDVPISRQEFDSVITKLNGKDKKYLEIYSALRDYNGQTDSLNGEKHEHRIYYALSTLCMAEVMKKGFKS